MHTEERGPSTRTWYTDKLPDAHGAHARRVAVRARLAEQSEALDLKIERAFAQSEIWAESLGERSERDGRAVIKQLAARAGARAVDVVHRAAGGDEDAPWGRSEAHATWGEPARRDAQAWLEAKAAPQEWEGLAAALGPTYEMPPRPAWTLSVGLLAKLAHWGECSAMGWRRKRHG